MDNLHSLGFLLMCRIVVKVVLFLQAKQYITKRHKGVHKYITNLQRERMTCTPQILYAYHPMHTTVC